MKKSLKIFEDAVSPVIGILLMLVVTIIIAAVVSGFAGGLTGGQDKAPTSMISAKKVVIAEIYDTDTSDWTTTVPSGKAQNAYVLFENKGGEGIPIDDLRFRVSAMKYPTDRAEIDNTITPNTTESQTGDKSNIKDPQIRNWEKYIEAYPDRSVSVVSPGSLFVLHFDFGKWVKIPPNYPNYKTLDFRKDGATSSLGITEGDFLVYDIVDKKSNKIISSGKINVPEFTVYTS